MSSTVLQLSGYKWQLLLGRKTLSLRCSADADREKYNKCGCGADSGHKFSVRAISTRDPFFRVSVSNVSGLASVSKDFGLELLVSRLCMR